MIRVGWGRTANRLSSRLDKMNDIAFVPLSEVAEDDIITGLARIKWLFVVARNSTFTYKGRAVEVKQVGRELGMRYVIEGSVRKAGCNVRVTGQMIDTSTGTHVWAARYDRSSDDIFTLQDEIALSAVGAIAPSVRKSGNRMCQAETTQQSRRLRSRAAEPDPRPVADRLR